MSSVKAEWSGCVEEGVMRKKFVIVGGGIAAVCCAQQLIAEVGGGAEVLVVGGRGVVKRVVGWRSVGKAMEAFDVEETSPLSLPEVPFLAAIVTNLDSANKRLFVEDGTVIEYEYLCIATGGKPKTICKNNPLVLGIRDTQTVDEFQKSMKNARRIVVVGNGGIATELVYEVKNVEVIWAVKHESISASFVDAGAAEFFLPHLHEEKRNEGPSKRHKYTAAYPSTSSDKGGVSGSALGPDWANQFEIAGTSKSGKRKVVVEYGCEVGSVLSPHQVKKKGRVADLPQGFDAIDDWPVYVELTNGRIYGCDLIISATGVDPNTDIWTKDNNFETGIDGGLLVNDQLETSIPGIYAAGDVCTAGWKWAPHWGQMRLWTQARQMGAYCGRCMALNSEGEKAELDICFEIFTHVTTFFGFKVILLGRFTSQGLESGHEALLRVKKGEEYVKVLVEGGRVEGAVLVGETDMEEVLENLILNQTDISAIKDGLLNPSVDIEDYFD